MIIPLELRWIDLLHASLKLVFECCEHRLNALIAVVLLCYQYAQHAVRYMLKRTASPQNTGLPTQQYSAPSASALKMSVPDLMPPST